MAPQWLQTRPKCSAWNARLSIICLVSSRPVSGFSLTTGLQLMQRPVPWISQAFFLHCFSHPALCSLPGPLHGLYFLKTENSSSPLLQQQAVPRLASTHLDFWGPHPRLHLKLRFPPPFRLHSGHTGLLAVPSNLHSHLPGVEYSLPCVYTVLSLLH